MPSAEFEKAVEEVNEFTVKPETDDLLKLYALYKQTTVGDTNTSRPGLFDPVGRAKWDAWKKLTEEKKSPDDAANEYIALVEKLKANCA